MNVWLLGIEPLPTRYTGQWDHYLPLQLRAAAAQRGLSVNVHPISGGVVPSRPSPGAFLDFAATNIFKSRQIEEVARQFQAGTVQPNDVFVIADAWHPGVHQIRYMSLLCKVPIRIIGLFHAGSWDPNDFLGRIEPKDWVRPMEHALFRAYDKAVFATRDHLEMFCSVMEIPTGDTRLAQCGWPMEYLPNELAPYAGIRKENIVVFPHRYAEEKQPKIFENLAGEFPSWKFEICQHPDLTPLTKVEYHRLLARARVVFSCSLQETLGIGCYEGVLAGAVPVVPDRLSYKEMYPREFRYSREWTASLEEYYQHKPAFLAYLGKVLSSAAGDGFDPQPCRQQLRQFFSGEALYNRIFM
ncbi:glycosyltransferase family 4 protein [Methylobacterium sp. WL8]|uniref:glycosyltransferase family 4 protein n=1 Tax=Methylobacterium sp. WL8 TaxID=2603899 RepID=UPI0011CADECE|nr:glycosyltransferase family 4 protein [Methylobacterium sp. WL8]TXN78995.1 glycosyltransferase family 4 protein [Methylobacterium sp. WL8]